MDYVSFLKGFVPLQYKRTIIEEFLAITYPTENLLQRYEHFVKTKCNGLKGLIVNIGGNYYTVGDVIMAEDYRKLIVLSENCFFTTESRDFVTFEGLRGISPNMNFKKVTENFLMSAYYRIAYNKKETKKLIELRQGLARAKHELSKYSKLKNMKKLKPERQDLYNDMTSEWSEVVKFLTDKIWKEEETLDLLYRNGIRSELEQFKLDIGMDDL